jgi:hypothetical protein
VATGGAALLGATVGAAAVHGGTLENEVSLGFAVFFGAFAYGAVTLLFRKRLPVGRFQNP